MTNEQFMAIMNGLRETYKRLSEIKVMVRESALESMLPKDTTTVSGSKMAKAFKEGAKSVIEKDKKQELEDLAKEFGGEVL